MSTLTAGQSSPKSSLMGRIKAAVRLAWDNKGRVGCGLVVAVVAYLVLRGCVPAISGNNLPAAVETAVTEAYEHCDQDFPIWPGEVRMPTCDTATIRSVGAGTVPPASRARGITRAICYYVDIEHMYWAGGGTWKHDMAWALRTLSKVAVRQDGRWVLYPDEDEADRDRWAQFECPAEYEASSSLVPQ
jgi:hypothetical protein